MKRTIISILLATAALIVSPASVRVQADGSAFKINSSAAKMIATVRLPSMQGLIVVPKTVVVAPGQPEVPPQSTVGIINALCDVTLYIVGCGFMPTSITLSCDANGDGMEELIIPLTDITLVNPLLVQATLPALSPQLPGTAFPITCCGGVATLTLKRTIGLLTQTTACPIDLGIRAPIVISATPASGNCAVKQNLLLPGSCYILPDGTPNVTSVFAVDRDNPSRVIQSSHFQVLNPNLIDALFDFGAASAGRTFLFYVSGPNGTSRNLTALPPGAPEGCPLGNEQGVQVSFTCEGQSGNPGTGDAPPPIELPVITSCRLVRDSSGAVSLTLFSSGIPDTAIITVGGETPKKIRFRDPMPDTNPPRYTRVVLKGKVCRGLPGAVVVTINGQPRAPFSCSEECD